MKYCYEGLNGVGCAIGLGFMVGGDAAAEETRKAAIADYAPPPDNSSDKFEDEYDPFDSKNWGV